MKKHMIFALTAALSLAVTTVAAPPAPAHAETFYVTDDEGNIIGTGEGTPVSVTSDEESDSSDVSDLGDLLYSDENWTEEDTTDIPGGKVMYRMYNPSTGEHFYTAGTAERNNLFTVGWNYERVAWVAPASGNPVYRLSNTRSGDHHYTINPAEKDMLVNAGWHYEGIGWYSPAQTAGALPVYRQYNPNAKTGAHNYTTSLAEAQHLAAAGWRDEGVAFYCLGKGTYAGSAGLRIGSGDISYDTDPYINYMVEDMIRSAGIVPTMNEDQKISAIYTYMYNHFVHSTDYDSAAPAYNLDALKNNADAMNIVTKAMVSSGRAKMSAYSWRETFQYRMGVCTDLTGIFVAMCRHVGVRAGFCSGYYLNRNGAQMSHAWPYAYVGGTQYFYDIDVEIQNKGKVAGGHYWYKKTRAEANANHAFEYIGAVDE